MKRLGFCALLLGALVSVIAAQSQSGGADAGRASRTAARPGAVDSPARATAARTTGIASRATVKPMAAHAATSAGAPAAQQIFEKYCSDCHTGARAKGGIDFDKLTARMTATAVGEKADMWDDVALMLESRDMPPPDDADDFPTDAERASAVVVDPHRRSASSTRSTPAIPAASPSAA